MRKSGWFGACLVGLIGAATTLFPAHVGATEAEHEWWIGVGGDTASYALVEARYLYNVSDFWALGAVAQEQRGSPLAKGRSSGLVEVRTVIDALTFVPALSVMAGPALHWPAAEWTAVGRIEASVAWRPERGWAAVCRFAAQRSLEDKRWSWLLLIGLGHFVGGVGDLDY